MRTRAAAVLLTLTSACAALRAAPPVVPLGDAAEVLVLLERLPREAERLSFSLDRVTLRRADGSEVPLELLGGEITAGGVAAQRFLARGRVPPGAYAGIALAVSAASLGEGEDRARLLVDPEPTRADLALHLVPGRATVVWLTLGTAPVRAGHAFAPRFTAVLPPRTSPRSGLYCTSAGWASVTVSDLRARLLTGVVAVPGAPRGVALDPVASRGYVALPREDAIELLDVAAGESLGRIRLLPGDGPADIALAADGTLVVVNERSATVAFLDPASQSELARVRIGDDPSSLVLDRAGRRAFVTSRATATVTVIDVPNRAVLGTVATDPEPLRVALSRDGSRLHVVHRGSSDVLSFALPTLAPLARTYVGLGATTLRVDPRTDLIYLSRGGERRISVLDPLALQEIDRIDMPGAVSYMAIDDAENTLLALVPERRVILVLDLTSYRVLAELPVAADPYTFVFAGERS
jgi:hypothetical protein